MAQQSFTLPSGVVVAIYKRRGSRAIRLAIKADGTVRMTIPFWVSYAAGKEFALQKQEWIAEHAVAKHIHYDGQPIGKAHHLSLVASGTVIKPSTRIKDQLVVVQYPAAIDPTDPIVQDAVERAALRALLAESKKLLPQRVELLAQKHGYEYKSLHFKRLKSRWGSCDNQTNIIFNAYLIQLPWNLIDYVILHELAHTRVLKHGSEFWDEMRNTLPDVQQRRKDLRAHQPQLSYGGNTQAMA